LNTFESFAKIIAAVEDWTWWQLTILLNSLVAIVMLPKIIGAFTLYRQARIDGMIRGKELSLRLEMVQREKNQKTAENEGE